MGVEQARKDDDLQVISRTSANPALNPGPFQGPGMSQVILINQGVEFWSRDVCLFSGLEVLVAV